MVWRVSHHLRFICSSDDLLLIRDHKMLNQTASFLSFEIQSALQNKFILIENWKWIALVFSIFLVIFINKFSRLAFGKIKKTIRLPEEKTFLSYFIEQDIEKGLSWVFASIIGLIIIENIDLTLKLEKYLILVLKITAYVHLLRLAYFAAEASGLLINNFAIKSKSQISDQITPLATKTLKVMVIIIGSLMILQNLGAEVTPILAGLGLGGMALAFAAQDTVANVFGTITILLDSPFKIGDQVKIADIEGKVEEVGFRSTRIRTLSNSLVTLSNSYVAKEKIENINEKNGLCRFRQTLGFSYSSEIANIESYCENVRYFLKQEPNIIQDKVTIQINELAESSINILIVFHYKTDEIRTESNQTQYFIVSLYKLAQQHKLDFAFPTRTLILENKA